jgi:hypothetical protein
MSGNINYTLNRGNTSSTGSTPLSAQYLQVGSSEQVIDENLAAGGSVAAVTASWSAPGNSGGDLLSVSLLCSQNCTIQTNHNGAIGVQTITIGGSPTGGTFILGYQGQITGDIAYNASAATVQAALRALSTIGGTNVTCTGGALPGTPVTCTFAGTLVNQTVPLITSNISGLTGGSPTIAVANGGSAPQDVIQLSAGIPLVWDTECGYSCPFLGAVTVLYVTNTNACRFQGRILTY